MFTNLWDDIYENLVVKFVGVNFFQFSGLFFKQCGCQFVWVVAILSLYLTLNFVISSLIVGTYRSACKTLLDIYHGEFTIARRTLSWYLCNFSMFELLAVLQRGILYIQMGFIVVLYSSNLFSTDSSHFRPSIQYICWNFSHSCFLLTNTCMWVRHVSLLSRQKT